MQSDLKNGVEVVTLPYDIKRSSVPVPVTVQEIRETLNTRNIQTKAKVALDLIHNRDSTKAFWAEYLGDVPELTVHAIPVERDQVFQTTIHHSPVAIDPWSLNNIAESLGVTIHAVLYTAIGLVLQRHGQASSGTIVIAVEGDGEVYPLKLQLSSSTSVSESIRQTDRLDTTAASHAFIGYDNIKAEHAAARCDFKVVVAGADGSLDDRDQSSPITILIRVSHERSVSVVTRHDTAIPASRLQVILSQFVTALVNMAESPESPLSSIDIISRAERTFILEKAKPQTQPVYDNVHRFFERQVELTPEAPALQFEDKVLSYAELNASANRVARRLPAARGSFVPVCLQRSVNLIISLVAILKTGAAYVVLDPETPQERNGFIVDDVGADFVVVDRSTAGRFAEELVIEDVIERSSRARDTNLGRVCDPDDPIYVIYTSGSTGKPKGVLHVHSSAASGLAAFPTLPNLRQLLFHNPVFSAAQRSVWSTLKQGGCLCLASRDNLTTHIGRTINQMRINVIDVTPSTALLIEPGSVPGLKRMTVAGELINPALIPTWAGRLELLNAYGLSENTQVNWRREMVLGQNPQSIGRPSDTTSSYVLVPGTTQLSPLLVPGELCLGGHQLALQYINRPRKTSEAFITNPFAPGRLYRTGAMVFAHEDGSIEMVGRIDFQLKINGQRVEPGDSNAIIQSHANVHTSSVVSATVGPRKALVAVVVAKDDNMNWPVLRSELKALLKEHIAEYMTPTYWLQEKHLPLNINGKVDIPSLAKYVESLSRDYILESSTGRSSNADRPLNQIPDLDAFLNPPEELSTQALKLREIWADILGLAVSRISTHDHFQELGGSSLDAIRVASRAYQRHLQISVASIMRLTFGEALGEIHQMGVGEECPDVEPFSLLPVNNKLDLSGIEDAFPTTALQDAFLADSLLGNSTYVYRRYYSMQGCRPNDIYATLKKLAGFHPILRTTFVSNKTSFLQVIKQSAEISWEELDVSAEDYSLMPKCTMEPGGRFVHFANLRNQVLAVTMHHALFDYWSRNFLVDDIVTAMEGRPLLNRPSYANYAHYLKQQDKTEMEVFWKGRLQGAAECHLGYVTDGDNTVTVDIHGNFHAFSASHNVSVPSLIYAAWAIVLYMHTSKNDIVFGVTLSGRDAPVPGILRMPGPTIGTMPFRTQIDTEQIVLDLARAMQKELWACSGPVILGIRNILKASGHKPGIYDTVVNILTKDESESNIRYSSSLNPCGPREPNHIEATMLEAEFDSTGIHLRLLSKIDKQKASFIVRNVANVLQTLTKEPNAVIGDINPTSTEEIVYMDTLSVERPTERNVLAHTFMERMARLQPDKTALQDMYGTTMSYHKLDTEANRLASDLHAAGATTGCIIPICLQKSLNTIIAILGTLKSGAAFTPLDPENPRERNDFIISDTGATIAITDNRFAHVFADFKGQVINMDCLPRLEGHATGCGPDDLLPNSLAYVIYTSGSTGLPKGVSVAHAAVAASTEGMIEACNVTENWHVLWFLNYVFDASYFDVFTVLSCGGIISIADQEALVNDLTGCVNHFKVRQLMITPTISRLITPDEVPTLQTLLVCGEPITPEVTSSWASRMQVYNGYGMYSPERITRSYDSRTESSIGPTEATILMTVSKVEPDGNLKSIGCPLKAVRASVLHPKTLKPVPYGAVGELCVSGSQVAMGYLNRPELTQSSFIKSDDGFIIYRTGDMARWLPNGELECLGRKDSQVKLKGFRIELGEIENVILHKAGDLIESCIVTVAQVRKKDALVVYYVPVKTPDILQAMAIADDSPSTGLASDSVIDPSLILSRLTGLAHYMVPSLLLPFHSFPLLPSGKINRKHLKDLVGNLEVNTLARHTAFRGGIDKAEEVSGDLTETERILRSAWAELFDVEEESIRVSDSFYEYGGDSIAAINLASMLRRLSWVLSVNDAVSYPLLREQASRMKRLKKEASSPNTSRKVFVVAESVHEKLRAAGVNADEIDDIYACAPGQVEFLNQGHTDDQFWQLMTVRQLPSGFDLARWTDLTRQLTAKNQILRAVYLKQVGDDPLSWVQVILKKPIMDMTTVYCDTEEQKAALIKQNWDQPFSLTRPFVRYLVLEHPDGTRDLCIKLDHAMYDGTLLRIFDEQFVSLRDDTPNPKSVPFKDFIEHCCGDEHERERMLSFWRDHLQGSTFEYPNSSEAALLSGPKPPAGIVVDIVTLPVEAYAQTVSVTASTVFQTAYTLLLKRLSGRGVGVDRNGKGGAGDVSYDYLLTGRNVEMDDPQLINGTCANFLPFRSRWSDGETTTVAALLRDTQRGFWQMTENGLVGLGDIYRALAGKGVPRAKTLFLFQPFEPAVAGAEHHQEEHMRWVVVGMSKVTMFVNYAVMFEVFRDVQGAHRLKMQYDTRLFTKDLATDVMRTYVDIVRGICSSELGTVIGELI
ncbi:NRPS [Cytospora paraplurivora]|uniref:NRPS n=1 Tax=Cytospora paraplurivora TaxID=2898453 RepID=A0AAN9U9J2_9PEZI